MAVSNSGAISLLGICREKQNDDYTDTTAIQGGQGGNVVGGTGTISLESCATSGSNHSPQVVMEATNTNSLLHPNTSTPHAMSEFYGYDHDTAGSGTWYHSSFYRSASIGNATNSTPWTHTSKANACAASNGPGTCAQILYQGTLGNGSVIYWSFNKCSGHDGVMTGANRWLRIDSVANAGGTSGCGGQYTGTTASTIDKVMQVSNTGVVSNYQDCVSLVELDITLIQPKSVFACGESTPNSAYFPDGTPAVNDTVYTNSSGTSTLSAGHYGVLIISGLGASHRFTVNSSGVITAYNQC